MRDSNRYPEPAGTGRNAVGGAELAMRTGFRDDRARVRAPSAPSPAGGPLKRAADIVLSLTALIFLAPLLAAIAVMVKLTSPGPALFWSTRDDCTGRSFSMPKFRTMHIGSPLQPRELLDRADDCLTPIGGFLRRSSLDELPQLLAVLAGRMSLIGPRPLLPADPALAERRRAPSPRYARPGLTGLAQINGRNAVSPRRKARYDTFYVQNWSWALDTKIFLRTVVIVLTRKGVF